MDFKDGPIKTDSIEGYEIAALGMRYKNRREVFLNQVSESMDWALKQLREIKDLKDELAQLRVQYGESFNEIGELHMLLDHAADERDILQETITELSRLKGENEELNRLFDLRYAADMRALVRWREAGNCDPTDKYKDRNLVQPDHADMVVFLMGELKKADTDLAQKDGELKMLRDREQQAFEMIARSTEHKLENRNLVEKLADAYLFVEKRLTPEQLESLKKEWAEKYKGIPTIPTKAVCPVCEHSECTCEGL